MGHPRDRRSGSQNPHGQRLIQKAPSGESLLYSFVVAQFLLQSALVFETMGVARTYLRVSAFACSLALLFVIPGNGKHHHPARSVALVTLGLMAVGLLHPTSNTLVGIAHLLLNIAIWAPLFWAARTNVSLRTFRNLLGLLWLFSVVGAVVGVLQVYFPERFSPSAEFIRSLSGVYADGLLIQRIDGKEVWRPCGLTDTPGGAAVSGSFAVIVGVFFFTTTTQWKMRLTSVIGVFTGMFCIYVCEIRSVLVVTLISALVLVFVQILQGKLTRAAGAIVLVPIVAAVGIAWSQSISGSRATDRIQTLSDGSVAGVYYKNRGVFIEQSILEELPKYPLGAGLGRYGMMQKHFGDSRSVLPPLWAEVQLTAWLYDGGLPLVVLAYCAVLITCATTFRIAISRRYQRSVSDYAAVLTALNIGWFAVTFNCPFFNSQQGMIFWLLNAVLYAVAASQISASGNSHRNLPSCEKLERESRVDGGVPQRIPR